jgi:hypothetical protein
MRVKAKLSRVSYDDYYKPIVEFSMDQCYHAFEGLDGTFTVSDNRGNPTKFTKDEFHQFFKVIEVPKLKLQTIYVIEYGSHYDSDPWENVGYANTREEAQEFIDKQFCPSLYHCRELKHVSKVKE